MLQPGDRVLLRRLSYDTRKTINGNIIYIYIYIVQRKVDESIPMYQINLYSRENLIKSHREPIIMFQDIPGDGKVEQCKKKCLPEAKQKKTAHTILSDTEDDEDQNEMFYISDLRGDVVEDVNDEKTEYDSNIEETDTGYDIESSDNELVEDTRKSDTYLFVR